MELRTDKNREENYKLYERDTGVFVRAKRASNDKWDSVDIYELDSDSLLTWLRSRGGNNPYAENCVAALLGHKDPLVR